MNLKGLIKQVTYKHIFIFFLLLSLFAYYFVLGSAQVPMFADFGRDLTELSNLWVHRMVWLGPNLHVGFPASPIYYYLLFPALVISGGNAYSVIASEALFAVVALGLVAFKQSKKSFVSAILMVLFIGFSLWWIESSSYTWNGHMYVLFVLLALAGLWFEIPFFFSSFSLGIAAAIHPVAILASPVFFYEWLVKKKKIQNAVYFVLGIIIPWLPLIIFEIITKGYTLKSWIQNTSLGISASFNFSFSNISSLMASMQMNKYLFVLTLIVAFILATKRAKWWLAFTLIPLLPLSFLSPLNNYYLWGIVCALIFILGLTLSTKKAGIILLIPIILLYMHTALVTPFKPSYGISRYSKLVHEFINESKIDKTKKYAVVSLIDKQNSAPQADAYRFFLRMDGVNVLNIDEYPQADYLILFVEVPDYDWRNWEDWTTSRFGERKLKSSYNIDKIDIGLYRRR